MSRTTKIDINASGVQDREALRLRHGVRLVDPAQEGGSSLDLPDGVYGFTHSPAIAAPLFREFRYRAFEMHRLAGGNALIVGFAAQTDAEHLRGATEELVLTIFHDRTTDADALVVVPYSRIAKHRLHSLQNMPGLELHIRPA